MNRTRKSAAAAAVLAVVLLAAASPAIAGRSPRRSGLQALDESVAGLLTAGSRAQLPAAAVAALVLVEDAPAPLDDVVAAAAAAPTKDTIKWLRTAKSDKGCFETCGQRNLSMLTTPVRAGQVRVVGVCLRHHGCAAGQA